MQEAIDQGAVRMTRPWMNDDPSGFVDDDQMLIGIDDIEVHRLWLEDAGRWRGLIHLDHRTGQHGGAGTQGTTICSYPSVSNPLRESRTAEVRHQLSQDAVETFSIQGLRYFKVADLVIHSPTFRRLIGETLSEQHGYRLLFQPTPP